MTSAEKVLQLKRDFDDVKMAGYAEGYPNGEKDGFANGYEYGKTDGYNEGYSKGEETGYSQGYVNGNTQGRTDEWNAFWDNYQDNGNRDDYGEAFRKWRGACFKPKYDIIFGSRISAAQAFAYMDLAADLDKYLDSLGVTIDLSKAPNGTHLFYSSAFTGIGVVDLSGYQSSQSAAQQFQNCTNLVYIKKLVLSAKITNYNSIFAGCPNLTSVNVEGEIGVTFNISSCTKLDNESAKSILIALVDYSGTNKEFANDVKFASTVWNRLAAEGATAPGGMTWEQYIDSKGWNK